MRDIEQQAIYTYQANLKYFEQNHPELHKKLITLDIAINEGLYQERYALEYRQEGYFDILEIASNVYLYNENSQIYTKRLLNSVNLKRTGAVFEAQQRFNIAKEDLEEIGEFKNFHSSLWATGKILHYNATVSPKLSSSMQKLHKFIFLGTGLGLHVEKVVSKYGIQVAFIHEQNLEIFRLSLFVTNYAEVLKDCVSYFSVMQNFSELQYTFSSFLNEAFNHNLYIKFLPFSNNYQEDLLNLQSITLSQNHILYPYQAFMARSFSVIQKITLENCFLNISHTYDNTLFSSKPVLILAAGPSLQNNTPWIEKNQDRFIIITVLSACKHLFHHKIKPDIILHIDPQEEASLRILEDINMSEFDDSLLIFGSSVHQSVINKFKKDTVVFIEEATSFKVGHGFYTLPSIGEYATMLPLILGAKDIFLIGLDLSLDPDTMKDHIDLHIVNQTLSPNKDEENILFQSSICYVKGNFLETVPSKPNFRLSLTQFNKAVDRYRQSHQTIYNISNGAYLDGTTPLPIDNIDLDVFQTIDKMTLKQEITAFLKENSSCEFREEDRIYLQKNLQITQNIIEKCNDLRKSKPKEPDNYLYKKLIPFMQDICEMKELEKSDIGEIFFEYFKIVLSFIFDTFNTKDLQDIKKYVQAIDTIVLDEVHKIASTYYKTINDFADR